jgi:serine/threonine protein kinase
MAEEIRMPRLSDTMTEGRIVKWNKKVGDRIMRDDILADVETDKATLELVSHAKGILLHISARDGDTVQVNDVIAVIGEEGAYTDDDIDEHETVYVSASEITVVPDGESDVPDMGKDYRLVRLIGEGGMSKVYMADYLRMDSRVAIKVLKRMFYNDREIRKRFESEARKLYKLNHPGLVKVSDLLSGEGYVAMVMEHIEGMTLREYRLQMTSMGNEEVGRLLLQMLDVVGHIHENKLIHRDIKPTNFMVDANRNLKLLDFGIAKDLDVSSPDYTSTLANQQMGTPMYMSPEQVKSAKEVTVQSDIYSLGVVLWELVTGKRPYDTTKLTTPEIQVSILKRKLPNTGTVWDDLIQKSTQKNIKDRFPTVKEFMQAAQKTMKSAKIGKSTSRPANKRSGLSPDARDKTVVVRSAGVQAGKIEKKVAVKAPEGVMRKDLSGTSSEYDSARTELVAKKRFYLYAVKKAVEMHKYILSKDSTNSSHLKSDIPPKKLQSLLAKFKHVKIDFSSCHPIWYYDDTLFGKGDDGAAIMGSANGDRVFFLAAAYMDPVYCFEIVNPKSYSGAKGVECPLAFNLEAVHGLFTSHVQVRQGNSLLKTEVVKIIFKKFLANGFKFFWDGLDNYT